MKMPSLQKKKNIYRFCSTGSRSHRKKLNYNFSGIHTPQNDKDLYASSYSNFVVPLVKAVQQLSKQNDSLKNELESMHNDIAQLKSVVLKGGSNISSTDNSASKTISLSSATIYQNVPNPFSNASTIKLQLPSGYTNASIIITENNGKILKTVALNESYSGNVKVETSSLSAGAYQYSLIVDGRMVDTKQMLL